MDQSPRCGSVFCGCFATPQNITHVSVGDWSFHYVYGDDVRVQTTFTTGADGTSFLPVEVFGERQHFIIDTGSSRCALDIRFRERLGPSKEKIHFKAATDSRHVDLFAAPEMIVGSGRSLVFQSAAGVCCFDFSNPRSATGVDDFGILGMDFLRARILHLNFDKGLGEIRSQAEMESSHVERLQFLREGPWISAQLPDEGSKKFLVDTGSEGASVVLQRDVFDRLLAKRRLVVTSSRKISGIDRAGVSRNGILSSFEFGPHRFFNLTVREGAVNALGLPFLRRFEVELDFPSGLARFRPGRKIDAAEQRKRIELGVKRVQGKTLAVVTGEPSEDLQGIQDGDRLHRIDDEQADGLPLSKIRLLFQLPATDLAILYEHDGVTKNVVLHLSNDPDPFPAKSPHELIETTPDFDF